MRTSVAEIAHPLAPCFIAAGFERVAHEGFDLFFGQPVFAFDIGEPHVIGQRHLDNVALMFGEEFGVFGHTNQIALHHTETSKGLARAQVFWQGFGDHNAQRLAHVPAFSK